MTAFTKAATLLRATRSGDWSDIMWRVRKNLHLISDAELSATFWDELHSVPGQHWNELPMVRERRARLLTGDPGGSLESYLTQHYLLTLKPKSAISLACGAGSWDRQWMRHYRFERLYGLDISPMAIAEARAAAVSEGLPNLRYDVADLNQVVLPEQSCDLVVSNAGIHHVENLENLFVQIRRALRPGGIVVMHDFVGPTRFQWTERQLEAINGLLSVLPRQYRVSVTTGALKRSVQRPDVTYMKETDPSEAVRSSDIAALFEEHFRVLVLKCEGGAILHMLLDDIAGNFNCELSEDRGWLELCFHVEDMLMQCGEIGSDFVLAVGAA